MNKYILPNIFVVSIIILILSISFSQALVVGTSKLSLNFRNVLRNGYAQDTFVISTDSKEPFTAYIVARGNVSDWLSFENSTVEVSAEKPATVKVIVEPPVDVPNGNYSGIIYVRTSPIGKPTTKMGSSIVAAIQIKVNVEITGQEIKDCVVGAATLRGSEVNYPLTFEANIKNTGNVRLAPQVVVDVYDQEEKYLLKTYSFTLNPEILPTTTNFFTKLLSNEFSPGQYWATITFPDCSEGNSRKITFDIYEAGQILDKGTLLKIENKPWAKTGEVVEIKAYFKNTGQRLVYAKFLGKVYDQDRRIVKIIETDKFAINPMETGTIIAYFKPEMPGQYFIEGRVLYNNKYSETKSSVINVRGSARIPLLKIIVLVALAFLLLYFLYKLLQVRSR